MNLRVFADFASHWLDTACDGTNDWCDGADLDQLGDVDWADLQIFLDQWLSDCPSAWSLGS